METAIDFHHVSFAYPNHPLSLTDITLQFARGRKTAIIGPNGAGKTTLLLLCNGTLRPDRGIVSVEGLPIRYDSRSLRDVRKRVGMVFQNSDSQIIAPTVYQDVAFGPLNLGMSPEQIQKAVTDALYAVGLAGYEKRPAHYLSGGEKKRVAIAGVLAMEPEILIFDEPTTALDPAGAAEMVDLLDELHAAGKTLIISTHDADLARRWADEVVLMTDGMVLCQDPPQQVFRDHSLVKKARLTLPPLLELYQELSTRGILNGGPPAGVPEMAHGIEQAVGLRERQTGSIFLAIVESVDPHTIRELLRSGKAVRSGGMGTRAKLFAEQTGIALDFTSGVIDKCLLRALLGEDTLILTVAAMEGQVRHRVGSFCTENRVRIDLIPVTGVLGPENTPPEGGSFGEVPG